MPARVVLLAGVQTLSFKTLNGQKTVARLLSLLFHHHSNRNPLTFTMDVTATHSVVSQPGYFFPVLKPNDIQKCMSELGFDMTKEELQEPAHHKEKLRKAFQFLVRACV